MDVSGEEGNKETRRRKAEMRERRRKERQQGRQERNVIKGGLNGGGRERWLRRKWLNTNG